MPSWFGKVNFVPYSKVSDFAVHLKDGRLMGSVCSECGAFSFPPRADCPECMNGDFEFKEVSGRGTIYTHSTVAAAPTGFDDMAPYTVAVIDLEEGGRLLAWIGETIEEVEIDMPGYAGPGGAEDLRRDRGYPGLLHRRATGHHLGEGALNQSSRGGSKDRIPVR
jgi:uncharacterized OB-fold protein